MEWTSEILKNIERMGASGKTPDMIALELNLTQTELDDERKENRELNEALNRAEQNAKRFAIAKLWADCLSGKNVLISKDLFLKLTSEFDKNSDNEIIIRRV